MSGLGTGRVDSWPMAKTLAARVFAKVGANKGFYAKRLGARLAKASLKIAGALAMAMALVLAGAGLVVAGRGGGTLMTLGIGGWGAGGEAAMSLAVDKCEIERSHGAAIGLLRLACVRRDDGLHVMKWYDGAYSDCADAGCLVSAGDMASARYEAKKGARWEREPKGAPNWGALCALVAGRRGSDEAMAGYDLAWASYHRAAPSEPSRWSLAAFELAMGALACLAGMVCLVLFVAVLSWVLIWVPGSVMWMCARDACVALWRKAIVAGLEIGGLSSLEQLRQAAEAQSCAQALDESASKGVAVGIEQKRGRL